MTAPRYTFDYFADPQNFSTWSDQRQECSICDGTGTGYEGPFYGEDELDFICEDCLKSGAIFDAGATTNEGDMESLREQITELHPELSSERIAAEVEAKFARLSELTPPMATHAPLLWPAHCGDYCAFIKEVGREDLKNLGPGGDSLAFLQLHFLQSDSRQDAERIHREMRPESTVNNHISHSPAVYLFQCRECAETFILSDEQE